MNQIAKPRRPAITDQHRVLIRCWPSDLQELLGSVKPDGYLPATMTAATQVRLKKMADDLESIFSDKRLPDETTAITFLLSSLPGPSGVTMQAGDLLYSAFEVALEGVPTWAVEEAARRWICGQMGNATYAPTPPQLRLAADQVVRITRGKIFTLRQLAKAPVDRELSDADRERADKVQSLFKARPMDE